MKNLNPLYLLLLVEVLGFQENLKVKKGTLIRKESKSEQIDYKKIKLKELGTAHGTTANTENSKVALQQGYATYLYEQKKIWKHLVDELSLREPNFQKDGNYDLTHPKNYKYELDNSENARSSPSALEDTCPYAKITQDSGGPLAF